MIAIAIANASYVSDYRIKLTFNTGEEGVADLSDLIERYAIAHPLKNISEFKQFYLDEWPTLAWSYGFDVSPETLYERATGNCVAWLQAEDFPPAHADDVKKSSSTRHV